MTERPVTRVRTVRVIEFDSPEYWANRPNWHNAHVNAYEWALLGAYWAWVTDDDPDAAVLWTSASDTWQRHTYALMQ